MVSVSRTTKLQTANFGEIHLDTMEEVFSCPVCKQTMSAPIVQCEQGHSMCGKCAKPLEKCPKSACSMAIVKTKRNYEMEKVIEAVGKNIKFACIFASKGCKFSLAPPEKAAHEEECRFRKFLCEGRKYAKWNCPWMGNFDQLEEHFKVDHKSNLQPITSIMIHIDLRRDFRDVQIISFFNGQQYFWYKMKIDTKKQKIYWVFQLIGTRETAKRYYYEFEIYNDPIRKFKVTEICYNDVTNAEDLFRDEKCVVVSFLKIKTFLDGKGLLPVKFRIMPVRKRDGNSN